MEDPKYYQHACELMESMLQRDDIRQWLSEAEDIPEEIVPTRDLEAAHRTCDIYSYKSFSDVYQHHCSVMVGYFREIAKLQKLMFIADHDFTSTMDDYANRRASIKHPGMLKIIDEYIKWKEEHEIEDSATKV